jgi:hypothetical protein
MNDLQFTGRYQCLPIRCSGRLISLQNEHLYNGVNNVEVVIRGRFMITERNGWHSINALGTNLGVIQFESCPGYQLSRFLVLLSPTERILG